MAKLLLGPLASEVRNSIGEVTFQVIKGQQIARKRPITPAHMTPAGLLTKNRMRRSIEEWNRMKAQQSRSPYAAMVRLGKKRSTAVSVWHSAVRTYQQSGGREWNLPVEDPSRWLVLDTFSRNDRIVTLEFSYPSLDFNTFVGQLGSLSGEDVPRSGWINHGQLRGSLQLFIGSYSMPATIILIPYERVDDLRDARLGQGFIVTL